MKRTLKRVLCGVLAITMLLALAACGGGSASTPAASSSPSASAAPKATTLRGTCTSTPETVDPARGSGENDLLVYVNLYECLVVPNEKDGSPEAQLAESWQASADGLTYTFKLKQNVTFADGTPMTAKDVKYSFDRMMTIGEGFSYVLKDILAETTVVDDHTVTFKLSKTFGPFVTALTCFRIVNSTLVQANTKSSGSYGANGDYGTEYLLSNSAGSGPYVMTTFSVHEKMVMTKNEKYWGGVSASAPSTVEIQELTEASTTKMLLSSGKVDFVHGHQDSTTIASLTATSGIKEADLPEAGLNYFMINTKKAPTDDVHIRKALSYACNYDQMKQILGGAPDASGPVPTNLFGYVDDFTGYTYDLTKAKEEVAQSKYASNLADYPIQLDYIQGNGDTGKLVYLLASDLESLGFKVTINETPWVQFCNNEADISTSPNVTNLYCTANYPEAGSILEYKYASWTTGNWNQNEWLQDKKFDDMLNDALSTVDDSARVTKYGEIQKYLVEDVVPSIYTCASVVKPLYNSNVFEWRGYTGNIHAASEYNFYYADFIMK
ncbi:putative D,D-dipeptide-binding periplasmic protein DdpA [bioreactor metagenome]|uniref:Putative D,D-dipeptide-binding periplasmic protein DdpA n=1 Tax=bioreactor metagenome TaxID=1076179 RepID=A0A644VP26_9ZZZZ